MTLTSPPRLAPARIPLLPVRPRPEEHELLSSWLIRLAKANSQKLHSLCRMLFGERQIWNRDLDRLAGTEVLTALSQATGISVETLRLHTLPSLEGRVFAHHTTQGVTPWILPLGVYHRTRKRRGLMYCPECLGERPAFLLHWRLSCSVVCEKHRCLLYDACSVCQQPVIPHRIDVGAELSKSLPTTQFHTACFHCQTPLSSAPVLPAPTRLVMWQTAVNQGMYTTGLIHVRSVGKVPLHEYLSVARVWMTLFTFRRGRGPQRLRAMLPPLPLTLNSEAAFKSFDDLDVLTRQLAVRRLFLLFQGWPQQLLDWSAAAQVRRGTLIQDMQAVPEWYLETLKPLEYVNPRRRLTGYASLEELRSKAERGDMSAGILAAYGEGGSLRQVAAQFGVNADRVRYIVKVFNAGIPVKLANAGGWENTAGGRRES